MRTALKMFALSALLMLALALPAAAGEYPPDTAGPGGQEEVPGGGAGAGAGAGADAGAGAGADLARTGSDSLPLLWIGLAAVAGGTLLVVAGRRRAGARSALRHADATA